MAPLLGAIAAFAALVAARQRRRRRRKLPARAVIVSPAESTVIARDGAVRSVQAAELTLAEADVKRIWGPQNLENLARTYWRFLSRVTLGLIRVVYGANERSIVLLAKPLTLLRFGAPEYVFEENRGKVRWRIKDGLLVARTGRGCGYLAITIGRHGELDTDGRSRLRIEVEVANFYPAIAAGLSIYVYKATQAAIHVLVTNSFLRSLAKLELAESKVRRFAHAVPPDYPDTKAATAPPNHSNVESPRPAQP